MSLQIVNTKIIHSRKNDVKNIAKLRWVDMFN